MKKIYIATIIFSLFILTTRLFQVEKKLDLKFNNAREIGKENLLFASIASVCEDDESNFYVLDRIEHKVFKFSSDGKLKLYFGNKGQGPGDFWQPNRISFTLKRQLVVADDLYYISFMNMDGNFIKRIHFNARIALGYIGENRFYGWIWRKEGKLQVMLDKENNIINTFYTVARGSFSVSAPDNSGRAVMFNYAPDEYAPSLLFAHYGKYSAVSVSNRYEILILNEKGETISMIQHDVRPDRISNKEKDYFARDINEIGEKRGWPKSVTRKIIKKIPRKKNYFDRILVLGQYVFVFRIRKDIKKEKAVIPIDIFTLKGKFLGTGHIKEKPIFISDKHMYFVRSDEYDNLFLVKMDYQIKNLT